jgi:RNA polymerase sigma factor (sigma-70 family)
MPDGDLHAVAEFIHGLVVDPDLASQTDRELLKRFLADRDENAFEALVLRHGPLVLALCRRILRDPQDAEDAFQAAFLVFVRRAASIARPELLGNWLYGVASRTARAARAAAEKRRAKEAEAMPREQPNQESPWRDLQPFLDRELSRLPARYRIPLVLCHLEEMSRQEATRTLGLPEGTLSSRLARGRALLARRLTRWCPGVAGEVLLAGLGKQAMADPLVRATTRAGMAVLAGRPINTGLVSAKVAVLSQGVLRGMFVTKLKIAVAMLCVGSLLACAVGTATSRGFGTEDDPPAAGASKSPSDPLLTQVQETTKDITDAQAKLRVLLRTASVQDRTGDPAGARKTRHEAFELAKGFAAGSPRADALLMVAHSQIEAKDRTAVFETLKQAEQAGTPIEGESERPTWLARLVHAQAAAGDYDGGLRTLAKGGSFQGSLLQHFGNELNTENKEAARKAITQALAIVKFEGESADIQRRNGLSGACFALAKAGALDQALEIAAKLGKGDEQDHCLQVIVVAQAGCGDVAGAARTAKGIQQDDIKAHALDAIIDAQAKAGDLTAARGTLNEVRRLVEKFRQGEMERQSEFGPRRQPRVPDPRLDQLQYQIALAQLQLGDTSGALVAVANIESDLEKADTLYRMGGNRRKAGKPTEARELLLAASQAAQRVVPSTGTGRWPTRTAKATILSFIACEQAKVGDITEAFRTANTIPTDQAMDDALAGIAPAQAEAGDPKGAVETVARIRDETSKSDALDDLAQVLARAGREKDALALAAQQTSPVVKARTLLGVIVGKTKAKLPKQEPPK